MEEVAMVYVEQNGAASADNPIIARLICQPCGIEVVNAILTRQLSWLQPLSSSWGTAQAAANRNTMAMMDCIA
jgi:hypothetical protein